MHAGMSSTKPLALVAEDTELGRWAIAHALQSEGFEIYMSGGWVESTGWLERARFDVAVVALSRDRDDVSRVVEHVRSQHRGTRLILLSAQDEVAEMRQAAGPGVVVLAKPLNVEQIVLAARSLTEPGAVARGA